MSAPSDAKVPKMSSSDKECMSLDIQKALEDIEDCQSTLEDLSDKASGEIMQVELKYIQLKRPHFDKRNEIISRIDHFWITSLLNHPKLANIVEADEEECLRHLKQINFEEFPDMRTGFSVHFHFEENPFFSNQVLTKSFHLSPKAGQKSSNSTEISWKPSKSGGLNLLQQHTERALKGHGRTFFSWFVEVTEASRDRIIKMLKDDIWPNPLQYFLAADVDENGFTDSDSYDDDDIPVQNIEDDSVVIVGDDDSDDDDVYEVEDDSKLSMEDSENDDDDGDDDGLDSAQELEETVESIEVEDDEFDEDDDDDEDAIHVLDSDSDPEVHEITDTPDKPPTEKDSIDRIMAAAMLDFSEAERLESNTPSVVDKKDNSALTVEEEIEKIKGNSDKTVVETGEGNSQGGKSESDGKDCGAEKNVNGEGSSDKGGEQGVESSNEEEGKEKPNNNKKAPSRKRPLDTAD
ncbi:protein SET-like isoform X2 [Dreissena polymorpha]|uniref:protein SET-like isoform X2 n=1 Tax=Dreissena polymorpha TaxID=45954 RepID=UPI0022646C48|nr:protein SET-like isoform X2 [Dreissena polymorpha]